jgi:hypothetical protein
MPLDPADLRWLEERFRGLETDVGDLLVATQKLVLMHNTADHRIKAAEDRNKMLWGLIGAITLILIGGIAAHLFWAGSVDASLKSQSKQIEDLQGAVKALTKDVQDRERREGVPKP